MNVGVDRPVEQYLAGIRAALADLPATEVEEIVDDVRGHLAELRPELGDGADLAAITARLGTPETYAAELRSAAGYPDAPPAEEQRGVGRARLAVVALAGATLLVLVAPAGAITGSWTDAFGLLLFAALILALAVPALADGGPRMESVTALPVVQRVVAMLPRAGSPGLLGFLVSLQPAWWVLRALAATALVASPFSGGPVATLVVAALFVPASVYLGRLSRQDRRWIWPVVPLNAFAALVTAAFVGSTVLGGPSSASAPASEVPAAYYGTGLWQDGERQITDIRPVDAFGNALTGVYLFDQDGRLIEVGDECGSYDPSGPARPVQPYPRGTAAYDPVTGECTTVPPGPLVVAVPTAVPTTEPPPPTVTPTPEAPTPTPSPAQPTG